MMQTTPTAKNRWTVILVIIMFVVVSFIFVLLLGLSTQKPTQTSDELTADTYRAEVTGMLQGADAANGALLIEQYQCVACHRQGVANNVAPSFEGIAEIAATRRPPLTAEAYLYEAIVHPAVFVVEGFNPVMLQDYGERLTDRELGDIIAYLLTPDAH
jgi:cytochrome c